MKDGGVHIGFTFDLKDDYLAAGHSREDLAEFDKRETIDALEASLVRLGYQVERIGKLDQLIAKLAAGVKWDLVFNIAEGLRGPTRESQIPALLEARGIPVTFGDSLCLAVSLHKGHAKRILRDHGLPTPRFAVVEDADADLGAISLAYPLFAKPIAEGTGKGVTAKGKVTNHAELRIVCRRLLECFRQPVLVEEFLPGREFTVGVAGTGKKARVLGVMEVELLPNAEPGAYTFSNKEFYEDRVRYRPAGDVEARTAAELALSGYRILDCRDAGRVDLRSDAAGRPQLMEVNPLAGLDPRHSDLPILCRLHGMDFDSLIREIVLSASDRLEWGKS
ncbi:MAG: D-alanine--D-alanine ligase [Planctomycetes bacterium]|nr:D-alanine--D-alanine ligase [Planctomycetota bacterium]